MESMQHHTVQCLSPSGLHRLHYTEWGSRDNPRVVVCVHGLSRNCRDFDTLAQTLQGDFRVICVDVAGRGQSDWLADKRHGWLPLSRADAVARASFGFPVVLAWKNPGRGASHVAMLLPDGSIAQAGRTCLWQAPVAHGFGRFAPTYYTHN